MRYLVIVCVLIACNRAQPPQQEKKADDPTVVVNQDVTPAVGAPATVVDNPVAPVTEDGRTLTWTSAAKMDGVTVIASRDSAIIEVPAVNAAVDYRVYRLTAGVTLDGTQVLGGDVTCAGYRQRNIAAPPTRELLRRIEIAGLDGNATVVVEALDRPCPFTGVMGAQHYDITVTNDEVVAADRVTFSIFTADEIRARYGSLIRNGHGKADLLAQPADVALAKPVVLARTTIRVTPIGVVTMAPMTFFEDFANNADQPTFIKEVSDAGRSQRGKLFQNSRWSFYSYGAEDTQLFIENGQLHTVIADWFQDIFATNIAYPRQPVQLDDTKYLKVTFDVASNATSRRYWWMFMCGAATPGATFEADGTLKGLIVQTSFFYQPDGRNPSLDGWNCFQLFQREGWPFELNGVQPESDVRVMVNTAGAAERESVVNVSPPQYMNDSIGPPGWYQMQDAAGNLLGPIMDDQTVVAPRSHVTVFLRRDRAVMFVDGKQRLCNDFPTHKLTMAEGALGFGQVLYHTTAERVEFARDYWMRTGQRYYLENTPYVDARTWDNVGYSEKVAEPAELDASKCYVSP